MKGRDFGESIHDWCNRYPHPMGGYGGRFAQWVRSDNPQPYNSFGNGAAMRVSLFITNEAKTYSMNYVFGDMTIEMCDEVCPPLKECDFGILEVEKRQTAGKA